MLKFLLIFILALNLNAGFIWNTTKSVTKIGVVHGVKKVAEIVKNKKVFKKTEVLNKYAPNEKRTAYQRDIDPNYIHTDKYGNAMSNYERMKKGQAPYELNKKTLESEQIQLHHSQQKNSGSIFELKESTHLKKNSENGNNALHPYGNNKNPNDPVDRELFNKERPEYWKERAKQFEPKNN